VGPMSNQPIVVQPVDDKKKEATNKEVAVNPDDMNKKFRLGTKLEAR
jgi:hypothetical protein